MTWEIVSDKKLSDDKNLISTMVSNDRNRSARIFKTVRGFEIELFEAQKRVRIVEAWDHSESWAENVAENWNQGIIRV
jgi:hypothetical protein